MRTFIALELPDETLGYIERICTSLSPYVKGRYVSGGLHVTMHFLGDVPPDKIRILADIVQNTANNCRQCDISLQKLLLFNHGNLVALEIKLNSALQAIYSHLAEQLTQNGFAFESRPFRPHITIVRNASYEMPFREICKIVPIFNRPNTSIRLSLFESVVRENVRYYDTLSSGELNP